MKWVKVLKWHRKFEAHRGRKVGENKNIVNGWYQHAEAQLFYTFDTLPSNRHKEEDFLDIFSPQLTYMMV